MISNFTHSSDFLFFNAEEKRRTLLGFIIAFIVLNSSFLTAQTQTVILSTPGNGNWTVPPNVTSITVEAWGGGGAGGGTGVNNARGGGGGAGGTYVSSIFAVTPGQNLSYFVGAGATGALTNGGTGGSSWFLNNTTLFAQGGAGGTAPNGGTVTGGQGSITTSIGTIRLGGLNGGNGTSATSGAGGTGGNGGGAGGAASTTEATGASGASPGGGGAGAFVADGSDRAGGSGGNGQVRITYSGYCVPPANTSGCDGDNIASVSLGTLNDSGLTCTPQYANRENVQNAIPDLIQNTTIPMSVGVGNGGTEYVGVWIDFNQNGVFETTEYTALGSGNNTIVTGNINVPIDALTGTTYMRVRSRWNSAPGGANACAAFTYGTTRDYKVNIKPIPPATLDYTDSFENNPHYWTMVNGTQTNKWWVSNAVNSGGSRSLYVSGRPAGDNNNYANSISVVHAFRDITIPAGVSQVGIYYDWRSVGNASDYFRVWLAPQSFTPVAGTQIAAGGGVILLNGAQTGQSTWTTRYNDNVDVSSFMGQNMRLIFEWINDGANPLNNTAAAIDNLEVKIPCAGTPTGGAAAITPASGAVSSTFNVSVSGASTNSGLSYQWQIAESLTGPWSDIPGATSAGTTTLTAVPFGSTTRYYRRKITCMNGGAVAYSTTVSFTTNAVSYCNGTTQSPNALYINRVAIVGTMEDPPVNSAAGTGAGTNGYSNYTTLPQIAQQAQGEGVNVLASVGGNTMGRGRWKAWIDWNGNGIFENTELVYTTGGYVGATANFGFTVPVNQEPGNYRMRIRVNNGTNFLGENYGFDFGPCDNFTNSFGNNYYGETEDYFINVVANCAAKITSVTPATECNAPGGKTVTLAATASQVVTEFRWYDSLTGSMIGTSAPDASGTATTFTTPAISTTTTYYVTAYNGTCESTFRTAVKAEVKPIPDITFTPSTLEICGETGVVAVTASGDTEVVSLVSENFEAGDLGVFTVVQTAAMDSNTNAVKANTRFQNRTSVFSPSGNVWFPAVSSGFGANKFAIATSDSKAPNAPASPVHSALTLTNKVSTVGLNNLTLKLRMYYSRYWSDNYNPAANEEYVAIEISTNNGTTYPQQISKLVSNQGLGSNFTTLSFDLSAFIGQPNLKFRIRHYSWAGEGFLPDGVAVDDIELYGERPLQTSFVWSSANPIGVYTDAAGTNAYTSGTPISTVYFKPTEQQMKAHSNWDITATASLNNGCNAVGTVSIVNSTKIWDTAATNWFTNNWLPAGNGASTENKCVIIKTPVEINANANALARNIRIETTAGATGKLTVNGSLTVTDAIVNTGAATDFIVKSDANLKQINENPNLNTTPISVRRLFTWSGSTDATRREYNFLSSPVYNQNMKEIFGGVASHVPYVTKLNESTNLFVNATLADYTKQAKGFAVREPKTSFNGVPAQGIEANEAEYKGVPNNGTIMIDLDWTSAGRGYNVVGNPYPSNIDIVKLYANSVTNFVTPEIDANFRFWDNTVNATYVQMGGAYQGYSYAIFNAISQTSTAAPGLDPNPGGGNTTLKAPGKIIKVNQAFMIRALQGGASMKFNNTMRETTQTGSVFYGKESSHDRYRLQLSTAAHFVVQNAVTYFPQGNNAFGPEDARIPNSAASDALFTYAGDAKVVINGRSMFDSSDVIPLGTRHFTGGTYRIQAVDLEGVFANGQSIYLKDKALNIFTDLTQGDYTFTSESGEFTNRFEIVYRPGGVLATETKDLAKVEVYRDAADFVIRSSDKAINHALLYDASGRLISTMKGSGKELRFSADMLTDGMYVLKATLKDGEEVTRKIRK